jgi:predicted RNA-binding protein with PUA domain
MGKDIDEMIKTVELYICDKCDVIGVGMPEQNCADCGEPMKLVTFVRALDRLTPQPGDVAITEPL